MAFYRGPVSRQSSPLKHEILLAVGAQAYINLPPTDARTVRWVPMADDQGRPVENDLSDGQRVEVLAWRPQARAGLSYRIRRLNDGREWWLLARYLRKSPAPAPADPAVR